MKNIITASGTIDEICTELKTLSAVFGKGAKLSEIARYLTVKKAVENQLEEIEKGRAKK